MLSRPPERLARRGRALLASLTLGAATVVGAAAAPPAAAATYDVNFTFDNADGNVGDGLCDVIPNFGGQECSLRAAIQEANASPGADTINLFPAPNYTLGAAGVDDTAAAGDLDVLEDLTIVGGGSTLTVSNGIRGFDVRAGTLTMSGMTVTGGTAESDTNKGGNIQVVGGALALSDSTLDNGSAGVAGGGLEITGPATAALTNVDFDGNDATVNGGALHATGQADMTISGGSVTGNTAVEEGGGFWNGTGTMSVDGTTFTGNDAQGSLAAQGGGALFNAGGDLTVVNATIGEVGGANTATGAAAPNGGGNGGGILTEGGTLSVTDTTITANTANRAGGGLENAGTPVTLSGVGFDANTATINGGAIHVTSGDTGITGGTVTDNVALQEGGGFWNQGGTMTVDGTTFTGNDAQGSLAAQGGGALFQQPTGSLVVSNATIGGPEDGDANTATGSAAPDGGGNGGGILVDQGSLTVTDSTIEGNTANRAGGGIESNSGTVTTTGTNFFGNAATINGGAIHVSGTGNSTITGGSVTGNTAGQEGGGFWNNTGTMTVTATGFDNNDAAGSGAAQGGGALFQQPNGTLEVIDSAFAENTATGAAAPDGGGNGGAILNDQGTVEVSRSDFIANQANRAGGAIEANLGTTTVTGGDAEDNLASVNGGVLHISGAGSATVTDLQASENTATNEGGALWNSPTGTLTVERSQLTGNSAGVDGGGVFSNGGDTFLTNTTISRNDAGATGGGFADVGGSDTSLDYVTLIDNSSPLGGNAQVNGTLTSFASVLAYADGDDNCDVAGTVTSEGFNHADDASCAFGTGEDDQGDPRLGPLRDNGGSTFTHFPLSGSPLVNRVPAGSCVEPEDQRTVNRPFGPGCDTGAIEGVFPGHGFSDSTPFFEEAIRWITSPVNDPQILLGYNNGTFRPRADIDRGEAARMIYREAGAPDVSSLPPHGFSDVTPFFEDAVRYVAAEGIFLGYTGNRCTNRGLESPCFIPRDGVTRGQLTRAKYQFAGAPDVSGLPEHGYPDSTPFFEDAIRWAAGNELVTGFPDGTFRPGDTMGRGNAARIDYLLARTPAAWADPDSAPAQMLFRPSVETSPPPP